MIDMPAMGATNWPPPSYDPQTELFYLNGTEGYGIAYLYDTSDNPEGYGGGGGGGFDTRSALFAIDIRTGNSAGSTNMREASVAECRAEFMTTAGHLLFTGDSGNLVAFDPARREDPLAPAVAERFEQRSIHLDAGWQAIHPGGRGRLVVRVDARWKTMSALRISGKA